jgi:hypothetical protein
LVALTALCLTALAKRVVALPVFAADLDNGVATFAPTRSKLRRAHAHSVRHVADLAIFTAYTVTALFGGATAYTVTALFGGATALGTAAILGVTTFRAA